MKTFITSLLLLCLVAFAAAAAGAQRKPAAADLAWPKFYLAFNNAVRRHHKPALRPLLARKVQVEDGRLSAEELLGGLSSPEEWKSMVGILTRGRAKGTGNKRTIADQYSSLEFSFVGGQWVMTAYLTGG